MSEHIIIDHYNGQPTVTSREVAEHFKKEHKNVIQAIKNMTAENSALRDMFYETTYTTVQNKQLPMYQMNRDGFTLLAMGFTGKDALEWKLKYIRAFNMMEEELKVKEIQAAMPNVDARMMEAQARLNNSRVDTAKLLMQMGDKAALYHDREQCYQLALYTLAGKQPDEAMLSAGRHFYLKDSNVN